MKNATWGCGCVSVRDTYPPHYPDKRQRIFWKMASARDNTGFVIIGMLHAYIDMQIKRQSSWMKQARKQKNKNGAWSGFIDRVLQGCVDN